MAKRVVTEIRIRVTTKEKLTSDDKFQISEYVPEVLLNCVQDPITCEISYPRKKKVKR